MIRNFTKHTIIIYCLVFEAIFLGWSNQIESIWLSETPIEMILIETPPRKPKAKSIEPLMAMETSDGDCNIIIKYIQFNNGKKMKSKMELTQGNREVNLSLQNITELDKQIEDFCTETLILSYNNFEVFPQNLESMHSLKALYLQGNIIQKLDINNLENLEILDVSFNALSTVHSSIGKMTGLKELNLSDNKNLGDLPSEIGSLKQLDILNIEGTPLVKNVKRVNAIQKMLPNTKIITKY